MTLSFSPRVTNWQIVHAAFPFFLVRHLYTRASRPQHLSSAIFCSVRTDCKHAAMCALSEAESLVWLSTHYSIVMPDLAAYHVEEDAATEKYYC